MSRLNRAMHIYQRSVNGEVIFYTLQDCLVFYTLVSVYARKHGIPLLGVGYEMAYAEKHGKPVHIFYDTHRTVLSGMLTGDPYFHIHPYSDESQIYPVIDEILRRG